jgi:hypothetical protein
MVSIYHYDELKRAFLDVSMEISERVLKCENKVICIRCQKGGVKWPKLFQFVAIMRQKTFP